ncbi:hypothetical protein [Streptomyces zingiberis]|uniref:Uncharacterized protein n=1 Tax=Streptomyces zingiberis TaxID=2053010 RepID=A0ABX1C005_9ACTN|nr:hypothetical protein [Streptomyces zingiberis]NJQ02081.1 hypothetical protein [Streptomyces zingiberis]
MSAGTRSRPLPAARAAQSRLPWWAILLPVLAFALLLTLIIGARDAHAAAGVHPGAVEVLRLLRDALFRPRG